MSLRGFVLVLVVWFAFFVVGNILGGCPSNGDNGDDGNGDNNGGAQKTLHERIFTEILPDGFRTTADCLICHSNVGDDLLETGHWNWEGTPTRVAGQTNGTHGAKDLLDNFWIAVPSNEGRCSQCHPSYGWRANTPASFFDEPENIDCFICHDTTGTYRKHPTADGGGGAAALLLNGTVTPATAAELQSSVVYNLGLPGRENCGLCHFFSGGDDGAKQGDLSTALNNPSFETDVHMGGLDFSCQECHTVLDHGIAGFALHSFDEGDASPDCTRCHGDSDVHTENPAIDFLLELHLDRVACQACHIPTFARTKPTMVAWYWSEAGQDIDPIPTDEFGQRTYDKLRGRFVWDMDVRPAYHWYDGNWQRRIIGVSDTFANAGTPADPVVLAEPTATAATPGAKVYPFKRMIGDQPADAEQRRLLVPHLFGTGTELENPYWETFGWGPALEEGTAYAGQPYSGEFDFVNTLMYLRVNHEIAPKGDALLCNACHGVDSVWEQLGIPDPLARE